MTVDIRIDGVTEYDASTYSIVEDATPVDISDATGGYGQITIGLPDHVNVARARGAVIDVEDSRNGTTVGTARTPSATAFGKQIVADSRLAPLNNDRTAAYYTGTLEGAITYYLSLVDITAGIFIEPELRDTPVALRGWFGNVWDHMRKLAATFRFEVTVTSDNIVFRRTRTREAETYRDANIDWSMDDSQLAERVELYWYDQPTVSASTLLYPLGGWNPDVNIVTVEAGKTETVDVDLHPDGDETGPGASVLSVQQPVCVASVSKTHASSSVYCVAGNDGVIIPPAQWLAGGGSVTVAIGEDGASLIITVTGSRETQYAPYRIMMPSGTTEGYSSLRLVGQAMSYTRRRIELPTGCPPGEAAQDMAATVDATFITNYGDAFLALANAGQRYGAPKKVLQVTSGGINRVGSLDSYRYQTIDDWRADYTGMTINDWRAQYAGVRASAWNTAWKSTTRENFDNQAFGNVVGARREFEGTMYRIRSSTITPQNVTYTAEGDTTLDDFRAAWAGRTIDDWRVIQAGLRASDFNAAPLATGT